MNKHIKKMIAPIIIGVILVAYYIAMGVWFSVLPLPPWGNVLAVLLPAVLAGIGIYVSVQRINEIRSGEEDDLSKY